MTKISFALAMLAPAGAALMATSAAQATTFTGTWDNPGVSFSDTFTFYANPAFANSGEVGYYLTSDSLGNNGVVFGASGDPSLIGIVNGSAVKGDIFTPDVYSGVPGTFVLAPGVYTGSFGSTLTLTVTAIPEPDAWALMVAGVALAGGAARTARRRRQTASATA